MKKLINDPIFLGILLVGSFFAGRILANNRTLSIPESKKSIGTTREF